MRTALVVASAVAVCVCAADARAVVITFTGQSGDRAASVMFDTSGDNLVITLCNTSTADAMNPTDILTAVFFDVEGDPLNLARESAVLAGGSVVHFGTTDPGGVVGGEWAYVEQIQGGPGGARSGISSAGFGVFGPQDLFPGNNLAGPESPDGLGYGITTAGDDVSTGNAPVTGDNPLIQNCVVFTLSGLPAGFDPATDISGVSFQYGTGLDEPNVPGVPTPASAALLAAGVCAALVMRRR